MNITDLIRQARAKGQADHAEQERGKLGVLRVGNSGIASDNGDIAASCHRVTYLRSKGITIDVPDTAKLQMFELGFANEDVTAELLERVLPEGHVLLRESGIPVQWTTSNGTNVSGRPDLVICSKAVDVGGLGPGRIVTIPAGDGVAQRVTPVLGLELKSVHSVWTAREVLFNSTPKMGNLVQAAHYMWKLDIPYKLIYKSYSQLGQGMSWAPRMAGLFPKQGEPLSQYMRYNEKGIPLEVSQFEIVYDLNIDKSGRVQYRLESDLNGKWNPTLITTGDIERYFEYVSQMEQKKDLGPRPMTIDPHGQKENYSTCDYCALQATCDKYETKGFEAWFSAVSKLTIQ